jgi:hypothetical protein
MPFKRQQPVFENMANYPLLATQLKKGISRPAHRVLTFMNENVDKSELGQVSQLPPGELSLETHTQDIFNKAEPKEALTDAEQIHIDRLVVFGINANKNRLLKVSTVPSGIPWNCS